MSLSFRIMCSAIWTVVALIYLTSGVPAAIKPATHKDSNAEQNSCVVFDYIVLPRYGVDPEAEDQKSYNLTIPLEVCYVTNVEAAAPLCQEAHELLHNISSCSPKVKMLEAVKKYIAEESKSIVIEPQADDVCHGFVNNRNIFASSSFAYKLSDPVVCPLICQEAMQKACTFLLWGYKVQATIHGIWEDIVSKEPSDVKEEKFTQQSVTVTEGKPSKESGSAHKGKAEKVGGSVKDENKATTGGDVSSTEKEKSSDNVTGGSKIAETGLQISTSDGDSLNSNSKSSHGTQNPQNTAEVSKPSTIVSAPELKKSKPEEIPETDKVSTSIPSAQQVNANRGKANTVSPTAVTTSVTAAKKTISSLTSVQNEPQPTEGNQEESAKQNKASTEKSEEHESSAKSTNGILKQTGTIVPVENREKENGGNKVPEGGEENGISRNSPAPQESTGKISSTVDSKRPEFPGSDAASNVNQEAKDVGKNSKDSKILREDNIDSPKNEENPDVDISGTNRNDVDANKSQNHDNASDGVSASDKGTEGDTGGEGSSVETLSAGNTYSLGDLAEATNYFDDGIGEGGMGLSDDSEMEVEEKGKGDDDDDDDADSDQSQIKAGDTGNDDRSNVQSPGQQTNLVDNKAGSSIGEKTQVIAFPEQEDTHFFFYFVTIIVFAIGGYVLFHNKQKIFALIIEGRHERRRRSGASYRKLETK